MALSLKGVYHAVGGTLGTGNVASALKGSTQGPLYPCFSVTDLPVALRCPKRHFIVVWQAFVCHWVILNLPRICSMSSLRKWNLGKVGMQRKVKGLPGGPCMLLGVDCSQLGAVEMQRQGKLLEIAVKRDWQDLNPRARKILTGLLYIVTIAD
jgi:hypothetical protein